MTIDMNIVKQLTEAGEFDILRELLANQSAEAVVTPAAKTAEPSSFAEAVIRDAGHRQRREDRRVRAAQNNSLAAVKQAGRKKVNNRRLAAALRAAGIYSEPAFEAAKAMMIKRNSVEITAEVLRAAARV